MEMRMGLETEPPPTAKHRARAALAAQERVAYLLGEPRANGGAIRKVLAATCVELGLDVGEYWTRDAGAKVLRLSHAWHARRGLRTFARASRETRFARGQGAPGRAWQERGVVWDLDAMRETDSPRAAAAAVDRLGFLCAFPVVLRGDVVGVLDFLAPAGVVPDDYVLVVLHGVAGQMALYHDRCRAIQAQRRAQSEAALAVRSVERAREELEAAVARRTAPLAAAQTAAHLGSWELDAQLGSVSASPELYRILGLPVAGPPPTLADLVELVHPEDKPVVREHFLTTYRRGGSVRFEHRIQRVDGVRHLITHVEVEKDESGHVVRMTGSAQDVSESKQLELRLRAALRDTDVLLREVNHRVKNNLQIICSLIGLQARSIKDECAAAALRESEARVRSIALVHERLSRSPDNMAIDFEDYLRALVNAVASAFGVVDDVEVGIAACDVHLGLDAAVTCGLIVNELISNAIRHGLRPGTRGRVAISLGSPRDGWLELRVADDGVGMPPGLDFRDTATLGLRLVCRLTEQLEGTIELEPATCGTAFRVLFPVGGCL